MLQLILGRAGFGKTEYIRQRAVELARAGREDVLLLVPDQVSFDTEKAILELAGPQLADKIQVFTFSRLGEEVFRTYGGITEKRVDDSGRVLLMAMAVAACEEQLTVYADAAKSDRITGLMLEAVDEFKSAGITPEALFSVCEDLSGTLGEKTREIALVYAAFEAVLGSSYIEPSDLLTRLGELLRERDYFSHKAVFIDGFEGFSRQKLVILASALRDAEQVNCTLCCDMLYSDDETSMFAPIRETARSLMALARENHVPVSAPIVLEKPWRFKNDSLRLLEERLFRSEGRQEKLPGDGITIFEAPDVYRELEYVAATIRRLVMEGRRYGEIAVMCRNGQKYYSIIESIFHKWEIPAFVARPKAVDSAPLMRLVLSAFTVVEYGFRTEDMLTLFKTGLCGLGGGEISALENYVYLWKINGSDWKNPFYKSPEGFGEGLDTQALMQLEQCRKAVMDPLLQFQEKTARSTGYGISGAIFELLTQLHAQEAVLECHRSLEEKGHFQEAEEQLRLWKELMTILDRFAAILGVGGISRQRYGKLLRDVLAKEEIMDIPLHLDTVLFGTADQMKPSPNITFLLGAVQGEFPLAPTEGGVFSAVERRALMSHALPIESRREEETLLERFYAYTAAASPSEQLFVSYHLSDGRGDFSPSELVGRIRDLFRVEVLKELPLDYLEISKEAAFAAAARSFRENSLRASSLRAVFQEEPGYQGRLEAMERVSQKSAYRLRDKSLAKRMFEGNYFSPSQIDTYHRCPFQYFCKYGLNARERKPAEINVLEYGTLMHYLFEKILGSGALHRKDQLKNEVERLIAAYADERMGGFESLSPRDKYRFRRMADTATVLLLRLAEELEQSKFQPAYLELKLEPGGQFPPLEIETPQGGRVLVGGVIDRVDIFDSPKGRYVRVVDYKTGHKEFKLVDVLSGLSLQMLIYLCALSQHGLLPAGALYMPSAFPTVSATRDMTEEQLLKERDKKLCMSGVVLDDAGIITAMEAGTQGRYIPVGIKPNGNLTKPDNVLAESEFSTVFGHVKNLISTMAQELVGGEIQAEPLRVNTESCAWCPFSAVCGRPNNETDTVSMKKEDVLVRMKEEVV